MFSGSGRQVIGLLKQNHFADVLLLFNKKPDIGGAAALIAFISKQQTIDIDIAFDVYITLKKQDNKPTLVVYRALLSLASKDKGICLLSYVLPPCH